MKLVEKLEQYAQGRQDSLTPAEASGLRDILLAAREVVADHWNEVNPRASIRKLETLINFAGVDT